jgi:hypothetical protein
LNEFNPRSLELAQEIYGLEVLNSDPKQLVLQPRRFDVISAIMVLEHIPHPKEFVEAYASLLKPGGLFVVMVPHFTHLNAAVSKASCANATPPFHVSLFQDDNLRHLLADSAGLTNVEVYQSGPPSFSLLHHYDYSDYWDIVTPTAESPMPRSVMVKNYPPEMSLGLHALEQADKALQDHFAETDGRLYLTAYARRSAA